MKTIAEVKLDDKRTYRIVRNDQGNYEVQASLAKSSHWSKLYNSLTLKLAFDDLVRCFRNYMAVKVF